MSNETEGSLPEKELQEKMADGALMEVKTRRLMICVTVMCYASLAVAVGAFVLAGVVGRPQVVLGVGLIVQSCVLGLAFVLSKWIDRVLQHWRKLNDECRTFLRGMGDD